MARMKEIIAPAMKKYNEEIAEPMAREARRKGYSYDKYRSELKKAVSRLLDLVDPSACGQAVCIA